MELKEAIEIVKKFNENNRFRDGGKVNNSIDVVLQALEELQKESGEYKEAYSDYQELGKEYAKLQDEIEKLREIDFTTLYMMGVSDGKTKLENKIKEKIEEIKQDKECKYYYSFLEQRDIDKTIEILQELLKGE